MPSKKSTTESAYRKKYRSLSRVMDWGFRLPPGRGKLTGAQRAAITRSWARLGGLVGMIEEGKATYVKASRRQRDHLGGGDFAHTNKGIIIPGLRRGRAKVVGVGTTTKLVVKPAPRRTEVFLSLPPGQDFLTWSTFIVQKFKPAYVLLSGRVWSRKKRKFVGAYKGRHTYDRAAYLKYAERDLRMIVEDWEDVRGEQPYNGLWLIFEGRVPRALQ